MSYAVGNTDGMKQAGKTVETYNPRAFLFGRQKIDVTTEATSWIDIKPVSGGVDKNAEQIEFVVSRNYEAFWDLKRSYLEIEARVVKKDGTTIPVTTPVSVINNLGQTMFRTLECTINQRQFGSSPNLHHIRAYMENLLFTSKEAKETYLQPELWYRDTFGYFDTTDPLVSHNVGLKDRFYFVQNSTIFKMIAGIHDDLFAQDHYLLSGCEIGLKYYKSPNTFTIMCGEKNLTPKIEIVSAALKMCQVYLAPRIVDHIEKQLISEPAAYTINSTEMQKYTIQKGNTNFVADNIFPSRAIPELIVVGFIRTSALNGDYKKSPLKFFHENVSSFGVYLNSTPIPSGPLRTNFAKRQATEAYLRLFTHTNTYNEDNVCPLSLQEFIDGYTLFVTNLSKCVSSTYGDSLPEERQGVVRIEVQFATETEENLQMIVMSKTPAQVLIDNSRQIFYNKGLS